MNTNGKIYVPEAQAEGLISKPRFGGIFTVECFRKGELIWSDKAHNIVTNEGLNHLLDVAFGGATAYDPWYVAIVETDTAPSGTYNYAAPTYTESTSYDEATRPIYVEVISTVSMTNSASKAVFTISATKTIYGASLVNLNTKGDTVGAGGVLMCYAKFAASKAVVDDDVLNVTYAMSTADDGV